MTVVKSRAKRPRQGALCFLGKTRAFSLVELVVTMAIVGILAVVTTPYYTKYTYQAKVARSRTDLETIRRAFINHYFDSMLAGQVEFPPAPTNGLMTPTWAITDTLLDGNTTSSLFSEGRIPTNPLGNPYQYERLPDSLAKMGGFTLKDLDFKTSITYQP